jgi:hypothetical protein
LDPEAIGQVMDMYSEVAQLEPECGEHGHAHHVALLTTNDRPNDRDGLTGMRTVSEFVGDIGNDEGLGGACIHCHA